MLIAAFALFLADEVAFFPAFIMATGISSLLEILRLRNARTVNCVFCKSVRYDVARADGLTEDRAEMVGDDYEASALTAREKAAIALADGVAQIRGSQQRLNVRF